MSARLGVSWQGLDNEESTWGVVSWVKENALAVLRAQLKRHDCAALEDCFQDAVWTECVTHDIISLMIGLIFL